MIDGERILFFVGTEAELIKLFPIMLELNNRGIRYRIIASGQNNIKSSLIFSKTDCEAINLELSLESNIKKSAVGLLQWWIDTYSGACAKIQHQFNNIDFKNSYMIVHGDTVSTYMGARIGRKLGMTVCHVEAGLRSHNLLSPFPEEIDRLLTSRIARVHFAPGTEACNNLSKVKGEIVNTKQNTLLDSLNYSRTIPVDNETIKGLIGEKYFVFVMHRQENLANPDFVRKVIKEIEEAAKKHKCVLLLHKITENTLKKLGIMESLKKNENIILIPRVQYFDFMKLLENSEFVITDGGSNQEELYYMQKPCLILRKVTERREGIGINARLFNGDPADIGHFISELGIFKSVSVSQEESPTKIIVDFLGSSGMSVVS
ncbi:UDP-N-acetylglucosamine 2-epimerase [Butyrivibrio sp. INlla16]|uniref:UDP-N-acetylglucosamine 2-epimerase n=1 Tax=Butyrivibrio sp. INlla16 TaxID=1520807 RepID=UPI00088B5E35|nr:UDP-N-acetylglucosamine 2-epimerase [Butyrivibrio sp. INlla16]SDB68228.1 UDP-N-acetylglucosamine 2-epimerase (non-hydrolysing) [Butyrivibrio sp. INlla16]